MLTLTISTKKEHDSYDRRKKVKIQDNFNCFRQEQQGQVIFGLLGVCFMSCLQVYKLF